MYDYSDYSTYKVYFNGDLSNHLVYLLRGLCSGKLVFANAPKGENPWELSRDKKFLQVTDPDVEAAEWLASIYKMLVHFNVGLTGSFTCQVSDDDFLMYKVDDSGVRLFMMDLPSPYDCDSDFFDPYDE